MKNHKEQKYVCYCIDCKCHLYNECLKKEFILIIGKLIL